MQDPSISSSQDATTSPSGTSSSSYLAALGPARETTCLLTLLDRFEPNKPWLPSPPQSPSDDEEIALVDLRRINILEHNFIHQSLGRLVAALRKLDLRLHVTNTSPANSSPDSSSNEGLFFCIARGVTPSASPLNKDLLTLSEVRRMVKDLEAHLGSDGMFDYVKSANELIRAGVDMLASRFPFLVKPNGGIDGDGAEESKDEAQVVDVSILSTAEKDARRKAEAKKKPLLDVTVVPQPIVPEPQGSGMAMFEVNFQAAGTNLVIYPDANQFHEDHAALWAETACRSGRLRSDYINCVAYATPHELIHCIQYGTMGESTSANLWAKEYGACWAQMNIMAATEQYKPELFPPGLVAEIVLWYAEVVLRLHHKGVPEEMHSAFKRWRDSRGRQDPVTTDSAEFLWNNRAAGYYLKARLAMEAFDNAVTWAQFIEAHFGPEGRHHFPGNIPAADRATDSNDLIDILTKPLCSRTDQAAVSATAFDWQKYLAS